MADEDEPRSFVQSDLQISELEAHNENDRLSTAIQAEVVDYKISQ